MEELLTYLLKSCALLTIFLLVYQLLLRNDTNFHINRRFLFWGIAASLVLPSVVFTRVIEVESSTIPLNFLNSGDLPENLITPEQAIDWWQISGIIYLLGLGLLLLRFLIQLFSLTSLLRKGNHIRDGRHTIVNSEKVLTPFSFFQYIMVNSKLHSDEELKIILKHEKVHASQRHSIDVLFVNLATVLLWFNPFGWWYKKSLIQNLEYLADKETIATEVPIKEYQHTLLKISVTDFQPALANNFYQSLIKKRIVMLNKKPTQNLPYLKIGVVFPIVFVFMFFFNVKTEAQVKQRITDSSENFQIKNKISAILNKNTTDEDFTQIVALFKKKGVDLKFSNLEYTKSGLLSNIAISFIKKSGQTGNVSFKKPEGLGDILIALEEGALTIDTVAPSVSTSDLLKKIGEQPLYIINEKEYETSDLSGKTVWIKGNISSLSKEEYRENYSGKAEDGVIIIEKGEILNDFKAALKDIDRNGEVTVNHYISILKGESPRLISLESTDSEYIIPPSNDLIAIQQEQNSAIKAVIFLQDSLKPLFIVNGELRENFEQTSIKSNDIEIVEVHKGADAVKKYGEKGKNGVVNITLKNHAGKKSEDQQKAKKNQYEGQKIIISDSSEKEGSSVKIPGVSNVEFASEELVLYVVDGKVMPGDFNPKEIDPESIESINVLKSDTAIKKYGEKGAEGAIEISLKKKG